MGTPPLWRGGCILNVEGHAGVQGRRNKVFLGKPEASFCSLQQFKRQNLVKSFLVANTSTI